MLTGKSAAVLFSFKRVYNILCCVKQVLGAVVANFLGEFIGKPGCQVGGLISLVGLLAGTHTRILESWHHCRERNEQKNVRSTSNQYS